MKKLLATIAATLCLTGAAVIDSGAGAEASIGDCSYSRNGLTVSSVCYSITAGGYQHQRAFISCTYGVGFIRRSYTGPTVGVLATSTVTAPAGGQACYGAVEKRP